MKVIWEKIIHQWRFLDYKEVNIILPNWKSWIWEKVSRSHPWVVGALVEHIENHTYVLVEQFRPAVNKRVIELVAWIIDKPWKTNEDIIREEIQEETWYIAKNIAFITSWPKSPWLTDEISFDYYAQVSWERWKQNLWNSEDIKVIEVVKSDLDRFLLDKEKSGILVSQSIYAMLYKILTMKEINIK